MFQMSQPSQWVIVPVGIVMILLLGLGVFFSNTSAEWLTLYTKEDSFLEWWSFLLFIATSILLVVAGHQRRIRYQEPFVSLKTAGTLLVILVFFLGAMEEVSWLQRILGFESSEFFSQNNAQSETNLHNLKVGDVHINKLVFGKILALVIFLHNIVLPLWARKQQWLRRTIEDYGLFLPPLRLVGFYLVVVIGITANLVVHERHREIMETAGALHYAASVFLAYVLGVYQTKPLVTEPFAQKTAALMYLGFLGFTAFIALVLTGVRFNL